MPDSTFASLIDSGMIERADDRHKMSIDRMAIAEADLQVATTAHEKAELASSQAVRGEGELTPMDAEMQLARARVSLTVAQKVRDAAAAQLKSTDDARSEAQGLAWTPVYRHGISLRLAAAQKADRARALLAEAESDHQTATTYLNQATQSGCQHVIYDASHGAGRPVGTFADETKRWSVANGWWNGRPV